MNNLQRIQFEPNSHTYYVDGEIWPSVSSIVKKFVKPFDSDLVSGFKAARKDVMQTQDQLKNEWADQAKVAITKGNYIHELGEEMAKLMMSGLDETVGMAKFWIWLSEHLHDVLFIEQPIFSEKYKYAGTPDLLVEFLDEYGEVKKIMFDYKTNKNLYKNYRGKRMLDPFKDMLDTPESKYILQQNLYKHALGELGIDVDESYLVWIKNRDFDLIPVPDLKEEQWQQLESMILQ